MHCLYLETANEYSEEEETHFATKKHAEGIEFKCIRQFIYRICMKQ